MFYSFWYTEEIINLYFGRSAGADKTICYMLFRSECIVWMKMLIFQIFYNVHLAFVSFNSQMKRVTIMAECDFFTNIQFWCLGDSSCAFLYLDKVVSFIVIKWHSIETILIKANSIFLLLLFSLECKYRANNLNRPMSMVFCNVLLAAC